MSLDPSSSLQNFLHKSLTYLCKRTTNNPDPRYCHQRFYKKVIPENLYSSTGIRPKMPRIKIRVFKINTAVHQLIEPAHMATNYIHFKTEAVL
jgi:hypothetical protein